MTEREQETPTNNALSRGERLELFLTLGLSLAAAASWGLSDLCTQLATDPSCPEPGNVADPISFGVYGIGCILKYVATPGLAASAMLAGPIVSRIYQDNENKNDYES